MDQSGYTMHAEGLVVSRKLVEEANLSRHIDFSLSVEEQSSSERCTDGRRRAVTMKEAKY